eukprot:GEZU01005819.1.p1 GENE.GEZU01005819.1~~GEZU01005819.1.p1  ORF type:complete len:808 (-),score=272.47 GEZU01005819.1:49-2472(-)
MARTGSGKTAAFLIPMFEKLKEHSSIVGVRGIILVPTRELALQTNKFIKEIGQFTDLRSCLLVGGDSVEDQFADLTKNPDIVVATPGRLVHIIAMTGLSLKSVQYVVFDEADRLFEMGFAAQLQEIISKLPPQRQTVLFSATLPTLLVDFARAGLREPELIRLDAESKLSEHLQLAFFTIRKETKEAALLYILKELIGEEQQTIIFTATRHHVDFLHDLLAKFMIDSSIIYGTMDQTARKINIGKFRARKTKVLIVTDVAARGIDIPLLDNVINYDFPAKPKLFVHRVGRAARAGRSGTAYSLVTMDELPYMVDLHLFLGRPLQSKVVSNDAPAENDKPIVDTSGNDNGYGNTERNAAGETKEKVDRNEAYYGTMPDIVLADDMEQIKNIIETNIDLQNMKRVCENAYKLYYQTRATPSKESINRSKELSKTDVHPLLLERLGTVEKQANDFINSLKNFRPGYSMLESRANTKAADIAQKMRVEKDKLNFFKTLGNNTKDKGQDKHKPKTLAESLLSRESITKTMLSVPAKPTKSFKDDAYYIKPLPDSQYSESGLVIREDSRLEDVSLDINAEDTDGLAAQKRSKMVWDNSKKKYVRAVLAPGEKPLLSKKFKNEAGVTVKRDKNEDVRELYKKWQNKTKARIQAVGEAEEAMPVERRKKGSKDEADTVDFDDEGAGGDEAADSKGKKGGKKRGRNDANENPVKGHGGKKARVELGIRSYEEVRKLKREKQKKKEKEYFRQEAKAGNASKILRKKAIEGMQKKQQQREKIINKNSKLYKQKLASKKGNTSNKNFKNKMGNKRGVRL